jgi:hypothetical protein
MYEPDKDNNTNITFEDVARVRWGKKWTYRNSRFLKRTKKISRNGS